MDQKTTRTEDRALDRRSALRALFGLAAVAAGATAIMVPGTAQAAPLTPTPPAAKELDPARNEDLARDEDLPKAEPTRHYYRRRVYRRYYYRRPIYRRRVYYRRRRYIRRVYY